MAALKAAGSEGGTTTACSPSFRIPRVRGLSDTTTHFPKAIATKHALMPAGTNASAEMGSTTSVERAIASIHDREAPSWGMTAILAGTDWGLRSGPFLPSWSNVARERARYGN